MKKAVLIGAGQTGRGFIAPILKDNDFEIVFIDKDKNLIDQLQNEKQYQIRYFGNGKDSLIVDHFDAYHSDDLQALRELMDADLVIISVFANHIKELIPLLKKAIEKRIKGKMPIICCENGVDVKRPLIQANIQAIISEGIIFCTTLKPDLKKLDLVSEDYPEIPIDGNVEGLDVHLARMPIELNFSSLIQRKIYTYNFISAIVAYLGSYMEYEVYGEAANNDNISYVINKAVPIVSTIIAKEYAISYDTQLQFTKRAVAKFQNKDIYDTIYRNARQVERKLSANDRLLTPLRLAKKYNIAMSYIELIIASALYYGYQKEALNIDEVLNNITSLLGDETSSNRIQQLFTMFYDNIELEKIIRVAENI